MGRSLRSSSIILIIAVSFLIGIWLENGSNAFYENYISPIINIRVPLIVFIIVLAGLYQIYKSKLDPLELTIKDYEAQIKDGSRALWKYFKDIGEIKVKEIVSDVMQEFIKANSNILAIQIYEYSTKHLKDHTRFIVNHKYSYVSDETDINALLQTYFKIPKDVYNDYIQAQIILDDPIIMQEGITYVSDLCVKEIIRIQEINVEDLTEEDAVRYALVEVLLDVLSFKLKENYSHEMDAEKLKRMNGLKRTGILKGIEMKDFYTFEYRGNSEKNGRKYLTKIIVDTELLNGLPHIILITLNPDYLSRDVQEHNEQLMKLGEEFYEKLQSELKLRYNDLKEIVR